MIINFSSGIKIKTSNYVYTPAEDTFLMEDGISNFLSVHNKIEINSIAEMGCGSGYIIIGLMKKYLHSEFTAIDKNLYALELTKDNIVLNSLQDRKVQFIHSDLFQNVKYQLFDLIIFNPPYLPRENYDYILETDLIVKDSWEGGTVVISEFLSSAINYLSINGRIMIILSNYQVKEDQIEKFISDINPKYLLVGYLKKKLNLETLYFVILAMKE